MLRQTKHAKLAPSGAHRWLKCPGSVVYPPSGETSPASSEGTAAHLFAEMMLRLSDGHDKMIGVTTDDGTTAHELTPEMHRYLMLYVNFVRQLKGELYIEVKVSLYPVTREKGAVGTSDAIIIDDKTLHIIDLKYGMYEVGVKNNPQLLMYGLSAFLCLKKDMIPISTIKMSIVQPRIGKISTWEIRGKEISDHLIKARAKARYARTVLEGGPVSFSPGIEQCRFCPGFSVCEAAKKMVEGAMSEFQHNNF